MKRKSFLTINNENSTPKPVKPFFPPHIRLKKGLKIYENLLNVIKKYSNQDCFLKAAVQSYLAGKRLLKGSGDDSLETIWLNSAKARKRVETIIKELNQTTVATMETMNVHIKNLGLAKKRFQSAAAVLQKHVLKIYSNKIQRLAAPAAVSGKEELEKTRLKHKELFDTKIFLFEINKRYRANLSFFGVTNKLKPTEITFLQKKKTVLQIQKTIQETTLSINLLQKELYEKLQIYEAIKREMVSAGKSFQNHVISTLKRKCVAILRSIGISKTQAIQAKTTLRTSVAANGLKPLSVGEVYVQESTPHHHADSKSNDNDAAAYVPDDSGSDDDDDGIETINSKGSSSRRPVLRSDDFDADELMCDGEKGDAEYQAEYHNRSRAYKRPRAIPIPFLPRPKLILHETFQNVLNLLENDVDDDEISETTTTGNKPQKVISWNEENCNVLDVALTKMYAKVVQTYSEVYPFMSDSMRSQVSGIFSTANDIQQFQRRRRELEDQKRARKQEKEEAAAAASSSDDDEDCVYDSDFTSSSSDDDEDDLELEDETLDFWNLKPTARAERMISVLPVRCRDIGIPVIGGVDGKALTLPSEIAAVVKKPPVHPPFKKDKRFIRWEEGNPNSGDVLDRTLDTASSVSAPPMPPYTGLVFGRFCIVCCQVVEPPDVDCICTDYRGLKRSQCEGNIFFSTLRMRNASIPLRRNLRRLRTKEHKGLWSIWRTSQRDLLLNGHQVFRLLPEYANDPRVGNHIRCFMRFVFANYQIIGTSDCVVCGDNLVVNRSYNFCNTCKAWPGFAEIWKEVQKETKPNNLAIVRKRRCLAFKHNRRLKKEQVKRERIESRYATSSRSGSCATAQEKKFCLAQITQRDRQLARSGAGKQPRLAFKTPKACHLLPIADDDDDEVEPQDNVRYAVPSMDNQRKSVPAAEINVNPLDVISFQVVSTPPPSPPLPTVEKPTPTSDDMDITLSVDIYEDEAMTIDFN